MKLKCILSNVIGFGIVALILQVAGLVVTSWMYAPSVPVDIDGNNITFYQLRGLWKNEDEISKLKIEGEDEIKEANGTYGNYVFNGKEIDDWFNAVRSLEIIGAAINVSAVLSAILWYRCGCELKTGSASSYTLVSLILAGILELLGVAIVVGKTEPELTSWAGALCGIAGTFCIIAASYIRCWQQEEYA